MRVEVDAEEGEVEKARAVQGQDTLMAPREDEAAKR